MLTLTRGAKQAAAGRTVAPAVFVVAGLSVAFLRPRAANLAVGGVSGDEDDSEDSDRDVGAAGNGGARGDAGKPDSEDSGRDAGAAAEVNLGFSARLRDLSAVGGASGGDDDSEVRTRMNNIE